MSRLNLPVAGPSLRTHEGAPAPRLSAMAELRRTVLTTLLWEPTFYEKGHAAAERIEALVPTLPAADVAALAVEARERMYLRHVPLALVRALARKGLKNGPIVADTLARIIQRPDELGEYLAIYWGGVVAGNKKRPEPLSEGSRRGLTRALKKFNEYQLAKYDRDGGVKLRDVLRIVHPKPDTPEQAALWKQVRDRSLATPDTWETELSAGKDKKATFERLLAERKLGALAFLRNLRNMVDAGVDRELIRARFQGKLDKVLPFRYIAASRHAPSLAQELNDAMLRAVADETPLAGATAVLVDISGSMDYALSDRSDMTRMDVAAGLAVLVREIAPNCRVFSFSDRLVEVANVRGLPLVQAILGSQVHGGTYLGKALTELGRTGRYDRVIVVTDEQSADAVHYPVGTGYIINVANYQHGVGFGPWTRIDGWSERVIDFIREVERPQ